MLKLGLLVTIHNRSFIYEYLPSGRLEQEDGNELLQEDGHFIMWEGYSMGDDGYDGAYLNTQDSRRVIHQNEDYVILSDRTIWNRIVQEDGFNILLETGGYLEFDGTPPINTHLLTETDFNILQEDGYRLKVEVGSIDEVI